MAKTIKLDYNELIAQSAELDAISDAYETSMQQLDSVLKEVNGHWSKKISNNFTSKIKEATSSVTTLVGLIQNASNAAKGAAQSFSTVDTQLSKSAEGSDSSASAAGGNIFERAKEDFLTASRDLKVIRKWLENNFTEEQLNLVDKILKMVFDSSDVEISKFVMRLIEGDYSKKSIWGGTEAIIKRVSKSSLEADVIITAIRNMDKYDKIGRKIEDKIFEAASKRDFAGIGKGIIEYLVRGLGAELVDVSCQVIDSQYNISKYVDIFKSLTNIDLAKGFNKYTSWVNAMYQSLFD